MKTKMIIAGILLVVGLVLAGPQSAQAADINVIASINEVGQTYGTASAVITTSAFTKKYFTFNSVAQNQMLATALTAFSLGYDVYVRISDDPTKNVINGIRVIKK